MRAELVQKLFAAHSQGDDEAFRAAASQVISEAEFKKQFALAKSLKMAMESAPRRSKAPNNLVALPTKKDDGLSGLLQVLPPVKRPSDIVLQPSVGRLLMDVVREFRRGERIRSFGLSVRSKLLFCGPPGCGKSLCAEVFAHEIGLPLATVNFDALVSSYLGETSSNLRKVFDYAERNPCVLFFDEFDAVAKSREAVDDHGELKRVVNSLLQMLDRFTGRGVTIAATNHERILDSAIWRRFDEVVFFGLPSRKEISRLIEVKIRNFRRDIDIHALAVEMDGFSAAEVERVCLSALKQAILSDRKEVRAADFHQALQYELKRRQLLSRMS